MVREALTLEALGALDPKEAAARFIARRAEGFTPSEEQLLSAWLAEAEAHRDAYAHADAAWQVFAGGEDDELLAAMRVHARAPRSARNSRWPRIGAAAALVAAACAALIIFMPGFNPWRTQVDAVEYASVRGEVREIELADGSVLTLDADSRVVARLGERAREFELRRGRAYFDVAHDPERSFAVTAAGARVLARGTQFDVNLVPDGVIVTLIEGRVDIGARSLAPGQQYSMRRGEASVRTIGAGSENALAWRTGLVSFDDQTLAEAAAIMNRYSEGQIVINDEAIAGIRISGQFQAGETERFAATLAELHNLRAERREGSIVLTREN